MAAVSVATIFKLETSDNARITSEILACLKSSLPIMIFSRLLAGLIADAAGSKAIICSFGDSVSVAGGFSAVIAVKGNINVIAHKK
ncbi:MAG: hypothetical protein CTY37_03930 [Methylotenera sp.]|nr:MAG: hypothetical protein CTY37_03930 [Methylotenera sp.]